MKLKQTIIQILKNIKHSLGLIAILAVFLSLFTFPNPASADLCGELAESTGGFFSCAEEFGETSFTQFEGGLQPPSPEGYAPALTEQTNLRDFVISVVNFILGFLGLVAVIVVIYGGFLYVIAGGEQEKTTKGKKSVTYAVIGIIIILVSFALVNTVIRGVGKGTDQPGIAPTTTTTTTATTATTTGLSGVATEGIAGVQSTTAVRRLFFAAATRVESNARNLANAYAHFVDVNDILYDFSDIPIIDRSAQLNSYLNDLLRALGNIISSSGELSKSAEAAKIGEDVFTSFSRDSQEQLEDEWLAWWQAGTDLELQDEIDNFFTDIGMEGESIFIANHIDFIESVEDIIDDLLELEEELNASGLVTTSETDFGIAFDRAIQTLETLTSQFQMPTNTEIIEALAALSDLHTVVQNIQFVASVIKTDVDEGNAPLIVNVDALNSKRPDFGNINEDDIEWDFGDGTIVQGRFATSHVYRRTGSYIIKLTIEGDAENNIASGTAFKNIIVNPPASQINLKVNIGDRELGYLTLYKEGFLIIDKNRLNVTSTEARDFGITFDASESRGGFETEDGTPPGQTFIQTIKWDFGDGSDTIFGEMVAEDVQTHFYGESGSYPVIIEVEDSRGIRDRKVFEVVVDSPAARINVTPSTTGTINENFSIDAGNSSSDGGQIVGYDWDISNAQLKYSAQESEESFTTSFENPGVYGVNLTITDNLGISATDSVNLVVESEPPEAQFDYSVPESTQPHVYLLDGTKSFDPDGNINEGNYTFLWNVKASNEDFDFVDEDGALDPLGYTKDRTYIKFFRTGDYNIELKVNDLNEPDNPGIPILKTVRVTSILDVAFGDFEKIAAILDDDGQASLSFIGVSDNGIAYEWDFGDETSRVSGDIVAGKTEVSHIYTEAGTFDVRLTVFDREDIENSIIRRIRIGESDNPISVISLKVDGNEIFDLSEPIKANRKSFIEFDASNSLNIDGTGRRLGYQWDFGDTQRSTQKTVTHSYSDISPVDPGYYIVTLKVLDKNDLTKIDESTVNINIMGELPTMQAFTAIPQKSDLITPIEVKLDAIGAEDPDGRIVKYLWWYYDARDPQTTFGHTITQSATASVTIGTRGIEGEEMTYKFGLEMTDQENFSVQASDILSENLIPAVDVVNGPNEVPVAKFNVDLTSVMVGEIINFTSSSFDPDGRIVQYVWDFEGDGFSNNEPTELSTISHKFTIPAAEGINVRLKVIDDKFAESVSVPVRIFVDAIAGEPVAAFTAEQVGANQIEFTNESIGDEDAGTEVVSYRWDFDVATDGDGDTDVIPDNDVESIEKDPLFIFPESGIYRVKLTVIDDFDNEAEVTDFVVVKEGFIGTITKKVIIEEEPVEGVLKANFISNPAPSSVDKAIHVTGNFAEITFNFSNSTGDIVEYKFDDNLYIDTNDNGRNADDIDYSTTVLEVLQVLLVVLVPVLLVLQAQLVVLVPVLEVLLVLQAQEVLLPVLLL